MKNITSQTELRCPNCHKLLAKQHNSIPILHIKCVRCGEIKKYTQTYEQILITDKTGIIIFANEQTMSLTGYTATEVIGKRPSLWGNQMPRLFYQKLWHRILDERLPASVELTNKHKNGLLVPVRLKIIPLMDNRDEVAYFLGRVIDRRK